MKRRSAIAISIMCTSLLTGCVSIFGPQSGEVVDKATGLPIENVVVLRSWDYGYAGPGGAVHKKAKHVEMATDKDGRYFFWPDVFFTPIPLFTWTEENTVLFYKPEYEAYESKNPPSVVKLSKLPANRSVRKQELSNAEDNRFLYESNLLKQVTEKERKVTNNLPENTEGVLYKINTNYSNYIAGITLDTRDNIYISTQGSVIKLIKTENGYQTNHTEIDDDYFPNYPIKIASDAKGNIYFLQNGFLKAQNINSPASNTFKTEANPARLRDIGSTKIINSNYQPKNIGKAGFSSDNAIFAINPNGNIQLGSKTLTIEGKLITTINAIPDTNIIKNPENIDMTFDTDGNLYIAYNDKYTPYNNAIVIHTNTGELIKWKYKVIENQITGLAIADNNIYICDEGSFYIFDRSFKLKDHILLPINMFGKVKLGRIKVDKNNKTLIIVDRAYARLLSYNLENSKWNSSTPERFSKEPKSKDHIEYRRLDQTIREPRKAIPSPRPPSPATGSLKIVPYQDGVPPKPGEIMLPKNPQRVNK